MPWLDCPMPSWPRYADAIWDDPRYASRDWEAWCWRWPRYCFARFWYEIAWNVWCAWTGREYRRIDRMWAL